VSEERLEKLRAIVAALSDRKGEDIVALDVRELASFTDGFVIATGTSDRHVRALADAVKEARGRVGEHALGIEGYDDGRWILMDWNDVVVHLFVAELREYYDLDRLWADATPVPVADENARTAG
jgi:ribosome-associated protein